MDELLTERASEQLRDLDTLDALALTRAIHREDQRALAAVGAAARSVARLVEAAEQALSAGGRLIYVGAGTSGRLGFLDAAECPPTFGVAPSRVVSLLAGGRRAMARAVEGAEDSAAGGREALRALDPSREDLVCGISASGVTPFVRGALRYAAQRKLPSALVTCAASDAVDGAADIIVRLDVGPEVVSGSTRMKAGLATKAVLHTVSTAAMIRLGKVYDNLMVDVLPTNKKLRRRAERIVRTLTGLPAREAALFLRKAKDHPKVAVVMALHDVSYRRARQLLAEHSDHLRPLIEQAQREAATERGG